MGRCCAVKGCQSGRKAVKNVRKVTLFKVPKDIEQYRKWSSALDQELKATSYICELHFHTEDIIKLEQVVLVDGSLYKYEYQNAHLRKNAAPKSNATNNNCEINNSSLLDDDPPITSDSIHDIMINDCSRNSVETVSVSELEDEILDNLNSTTMVFVEHPDTSIGDDDLVTRNEPEEFSFHSIQSIFECQPLRKNWSWAVIKKEFISLSYINSKLELVCHIKIDMDLKVTIINAKTNIVVKKDVNISSIASVWQLLLSLENSFFCIGTGYDEPRCSQTCTGISQNERNKKKVVEYRCVTCQRLRCFIQKRRSRDADSEARWMNFKHRYNLQRRKLNRVVLQKKNLKQELLNLKNQCGEIEEEVLSAKIALQPEKNNHLKRITLIRKTGEHRD